MQPPAAEWRRLTVLEQRTLDVMGIDEPVAVPWGALRRLAERNLVEPRRSGHVLTARGVAVRDFGRNKG